MTTIGELHRAAGVDETHLRGRVKIVGWQCGRCKEIFRNLDQVDSEPTGGTWGPNGNGWNYWCKSCEYRCEPLTK